MLKSKLHRATVTDANLEYEGSVSIDPVLSQSAGLLPNEKVDILNLNNGERFTTYVIKGGRGEVCLNGAAARKACIGDRVIIVSYARMSREEAEQWKPWVVLLGKNNTIEKAPLS